MPESDGGLAGRARFGHPPVLLALADRRPPAQLLVLLGQLARGLTAQLLLGGELGEQLLVLLVQAGPVRLQPGHLEAQLLGAQLQGLQLGL